MLAAALALAVAGCSVLGSSGGPPPTFDLTAAQHFPHAMRAPRGQLIVQDATALGPLDSDKIVVRPADDQLAALSDAQWSERLPRLVQVRTIQTFENARRLRAVGRPGDRMAADYQLLLDIRNFEIVAGSAPSAEVTIAAKIAGDRSGRIIAGRVFTARVPARAAEGPPAIAALDEAWNKVAADIVLWVSKII